MVSATHLELPDCDSAASVLDFARQRRAAADRAEADLLAAAVTWAAIHSADSLDRAACLPGSEGECAIAGPGAPLVAEFAPLELAAALSMSTDAGRALLGEAVELAHRLPRTWARVQAGSVPAWRGRRIARSTTTLPVEGAAFVDAQVAEYADRIGVAALDRLLEEARVRFDPDAAEEARREAADDRHLDLHLHRVTFDGTVHVDGVLDVADALSLDTALAQGAAQLKALGSTESLDVRRSRAAGELARRDLALDLAASDAAEQPTVRARQVVLHVHLAQAALDSPGLHLARVEETRSFVSAEQVRDWCRSADTQVTVKPVVDLEEHTQVGAYEIPDRLAERVRLTSPMCVFPWCTRSSRRADLDHIEPYDEGGATADENLAPLCRTHHRAKTHIAWTYTKVDPTTFWWRSPLGLQLLRDHTGTRLLDPRGRAPD